MKVDKKIIDDALDWKIDDNDNVHCPHCGANLQKELDGNELKVFGNSGTHIIKDPDFCECSTSTTVYWKCPECRKPISEFISLDN